MQRSKKNFSGIFRAKIGRRSPSNCPIFNERYVVERLIESVCRFDYPRELLEIQILDDSTDDTVDIVKALGQPR